MSDDPEGATDRIAPARLMESATRPDVRPASSPGGGDVERTAHAQNAVILTVRLTQQLRKKKYGPFEVRVHEPQETTGGGAQSRQSIVLSKGGQEREIMVGWLDSVQHAIELRPYPEMVSRHQSRFNAPFPLSINDYEALIQDFGLFAKQLGLSVAISEPASAHEISGVIRTAHANSPSKQLSTGILIAGAVLILVVGLLAGLILAKSLG